MKPFTFQKAEPVWAVGRSREKNCELSFLFTLDGTASTLLAVAASSVYRCWINGRFVAAGPARTAHRHFRVDELELTPYLVDGKNVVVIEVVGYNINSYDTLDQPAFLAAEFYREGNVVSYTGDDSMRVYERSQRVSKVQRYSYQRAFSEAYRFCAKDAAFYKTGHCDNVPVQMEHQYPGIFIDREVRKPQYECLRPEKILEYGDADFSYKCTSPVRDRSYLDIGEALHGFVPDELEWRLSDDGQNISFRSRKIPDGITLPVEMQHAYAMMAFPYNATGFLRFSISCETECTVTVLFDEILIGGRLDFLRLTSCNCFRYELDAGEHRVMTFVPYTMKYVKIIVNGKAVLQNVDVLEYKHPPVKYRVNVPVDSALEAINNAATETFRANAVDIFTDCPSRERAGWLCDSFFMARVERILTGESILEHAFLENFLITEGFRNIPEGMLPMCYPADHYNKEFIPNWAMWFVLELEEYVQRSQDVLLAERARPRVYALLKYFEEFENEHGLLERLENWVFVEWSRANDPDVVQDVNFPTNMLYARMLQAVANLYGDTYQEEKCERIRKVIRSRSLKGLFFTDNERRTAEGLVNPMICTEVCQYYAFFTGTASCETDRALWDTLVKDFGPERKQTRLYENVAFANAFIGNYLRLELLYRAGMYDEVVNNIKGYFSEMASKTGTLWEHDAPSASCNHGFASHVVYWLAGIYGVSENEEETV